jgi:hypothetical protein
MPENFTNCTKGTLFEDTFRPYSAKRLIINKNLKEIFRKIKTFFLDL